jgi:membrane protein implicated in regulation of membrane protease activity
MFESFSNWYSALEPMMQMFWGCAIVASLVFVVQMILTLIGMDGHDVDTGFDMADFGDTDASTMDTGGGLSLFSIRSLVNFLVGFGWSGVSFHKLIGNNILLVLVSVVVGLVFVWLFFYIRKQTRKLEANGAFDIRNCEGKTANVYLRIPGNNKGKGKIQISINGAFHEIDALTDGDDISTGQKVKITEVIDGETLRVTPL